MTGAFCGQCGARAEGDAPKYSAAPAVTATAGGLADNVAGALCYILWLITGILLLIIAPYNTKPAVRFHAFQSIFLSLSWFAFWIVWGMLMSIMPFFISGVLASLSRLIGPAFFVLWLFLMYRAYQNQPFVLPVIGRIAQQWANKQ